jgi:hypothetical protein
LREDPAKKEVFTLVSHSDTKTALVCLNSLFRQSVEPIRIVVLNDGTLDNYDKEQLHSIGIGTRVIDKAEVEELCLSKLARYPTCSAFRSTNILFRKLFDLPLFTSADFFYADSDVYFFKPFVGLFTLNEMEQDVLFMDNGTESYSLRPWHLIGPKAARLASGINTGIICLRAGYLDLDYVEYLLRKLGHVFEQHHTWWAEQTCWAALAMRMRAFVCDPEQVAVMRPGLAVSNATCAVHFVSTFRGALPEYASRYPAGRPPNDVVRVSASRVRKCTILGMTKSLVRARLR